MIFKVQHFTRDARAYAENPQLPRHSQSAARGDDCFS